jgi:hypothetical protein
MYVSAKGHRMRIGMAKVKGDKRAQVEINSFDYWAPKNKDLFGIPTRSAVAGSDQNIVQIVQSVLNYVVDGDLEKIDENASAPLSRNERLIVEGVSDSRLENPHVKYAVEVLGTDINTFKPGLSDVSYYNQVRAISGFNKAEFTEWRRGFKVVTNKETNTMQDGAKALDKKFEETKYADINYVFEDIEKLAVLVASGASNALVVSGTQGGTGKSHHVLKAMTAALGSPDGPDAKWRYFKGAKVSPLGLFTTLFVNRNETIVFDDSDSIFSTEDTINMLKSAIDTSEPRKISWTSAVTQNVTKLTDAEKRELYNKIDDAYMDDPSSVGVKDLKLPSEFNFGGRLIVITNLPKSKLNQPILSRSYVVDVTLRQEDLMLRIKTILKAKNVVDESTADTIMEKLGKSGGSVTMRAVETAVALVKAGFNDWERLVQNYVAS